MKKARTHNSGITIKSINNTTASLSHNSLLMLPAVTKMESLNGKSPNCRLLMLT
jgi:hypothetical protein